MALFCDAMPGGGSKLCGKAGVVLKLVPYGKLAPYQYFRSA
jgi:hypothetical protein